MEAMDTEPGRSLPGYTGGGTGAAEQRTMSRGEGDNEAEAIRVF